MTITIAQNRKNNPYIQRQTGNYVFVYEVTGTPEEVAAYKASNPKAVEDTATKKMLFFTTKYSGDTAELKKSEKGTFYAEVDNMKVLAEAAAKYGIGVASMICKGPRKADAVAA